MKIYKLLIVLLSLASGSATMAQSSIPATGGNAQGSGGSVSYTVGQPVYRIFKGTNGSVTQGVQQPYEISVIIAIEELNTISLEIIVYPNPATDYLKLKAENYETDSLSYHLYNMNGSLLENKKIESDETDINVRHFTAGTYFLKVSDKQREIKTFKIIKH